MLGISRPLRNEHWARQRARIFARPRREFRPSLGQSEPRAALQFIRRFKLHVLPHGFRRVRHYGFLSAPNKKKQLTQCRRLLAQQRGVFDSSLMAIMQRLKEQDARQEKKIFAQWLRDLTQVDIRLCPRCRKPCLKRRPIFAKDRDDDDDHPTFWDTS